MKKPGDPQGFPGIFIPCSSQIAGDRQIDKRNDNSYDAQGDETGMKNIRRRLTHLAGIAVMMVPLLITVYLLYWSPADLSARQTEDQRVFGATYMTMNNPYFQVLDTQIRAHVELNGDILLTRDGAMDHPSSSLASTVHSQPSRMKNM